MDAYGPPLPPGFQLPVHVDSDEDCKPPNKKTKVIGPQIPEFLSKKQDLEYLDSSELKDVSDSGKLVGPMLPPTFKQNKNIEEESDTFGPMPSQTKLDYNIVSIIEKRAASMKDRLDMKDTPVNESTEREEWMVVPDTSKRNQLGAISRCLAPDSKASKKETQCCRNLEEDEKTTKELKKYNKSKRGESLIDIHKKKKKKDEKEKKSSEQKERQAFDRDEIAVRNFTKKQVNSVIDKAKYLNSRFAPGRSEQYL